MSYSNRVTRTLGQRAQDRHVAGVIQRMPDLQMDRMIEALSGQRGRTLRRGRRGSRFARHTREKSWVCGCGRRHKRLYFGPGKADQNICPLCLDHAGPES